MAIEVLLESFVSLAVYVVVELQKLVLNNNGCGTWPDVI